MADLSNDPELIARAQANETSPEAEIASLKESIDPAKVDAVYAQLLDVRNRFAHYQRKGTVREDELPWPVWTDKSTANRKPAGYIEFSDGNTESVLMDPAFIENFPPKEVAAVYAHELGHDVRDDKGEPANSKECGADYVAMHVGYGQPLESALRGYIVNFPDSLEVEDQKNLLRRTIMVQNNLDSKTPEHNLDFDQNCTPSLKPKSPNSRG